MHLMGNKPEVQSTGAVLHWHALYTRHQHEQSVARHLSNCGHKVFLPLYSVTHKWQDRTKQLHLPLFPSYVFFQGGLDRQTQIVSAPGVSSIVGWAGRPAIIPQEEIDTVLRMVESPFHIESHAYLQCGERVRIKDGPLQGVEGVLVRKKNLFRLVVSLKLLGRSAAVEISMSSIERVVPSHLAIETQQLPTCI
jgi:transcription antitermination factor NusG